MAFKMKGSPLQRNFDRSPMKHTGKGKHYHGPEWLPDRILKSGSAEGTNPYAERAAYKKRIRRGGTLSEVDRKRMMKEWTKNWKEKHKYESMPSLDQMEGMPYDPKNPDATLEEGGGSIMDNLRMVPISSGDANPRVLMSSSYKGEDKMGVLTDKHGEPVDSENVYPEGEPLTVYGTNKELLEKTK